jgi:hypothetical protein
MQEVGTISGAAVAGTAALISSYYLSQNVQYVLHSGSARSMSLCTSVPVSLLKLCLAL